MKKLLTFALLIGLFSVFAVAQAQDLPDVEIDDLETEPSAIRSLLLQEGLSGAFTENDDDSFTLTVNVGELGDVVTILPSVPSTEIVNLINLLNDWGTVEDLTANGTLSFEEGTVQMDLTAPRYDAETGEITFTALNLQVFDAEGLTDKVEVPAEFSNANLLTQFSAGFQLEILNVEADGIRAVDCGTLVSDFRTKLNHYRQYESFDEPDPNVLNNLLVEALTARAIAQDNRCSGV